MKRFSFATGGLCAALCASSLFLTLAAGCAPKPDETAAAPESTPAPVAAASPSAEASPSPGASPSTGASAVVGPPSPGTAPPGPAAMKGSGKVTKTASGLQYEDIKIGTGATPKAGQFVSVHYTGTLQDGTKFDSSRDRGQPIEFPLGQGRVIKGWDEAISTMKVGGQRKLTIPPDLAYGAAPPPGAPIPPNATLLFDVELVGVSDTPTQ